MKVYDWEVLVVNNVSSLKGDYYILDMLMNSLSSITIGAIVLCALLLYLNFKNKRATRSLVVKILVGFSLADFTSRFLFKYTFLRPRPKFLDVVCEGSHCYGFVSSHAADIFAVATVFILMNKRSATWAIPLSFLVCFSRLFLRDHFPLDLIGGAVVGVLAGIVSNYVLNRFQKRFITV